jgi:ATP-dependent Lon protease
VEKLVWSKRGSDKREKEAILRLCTAYLKLFFPHADNERIQEVGFKKDFVRYCLEPAKQMRQTVLYQMQIIDPAQFGSRVMSTYKLRED